MALHLTPTEHDADPPSAWTVSKSGSRWALVSSTGVTMDTFTTKRAAIEAKSSGFYVNLYNTETAWFAGLPVRGLKSYAECLAERTRQS